MNRRAFLSLLGFAPVALPAIAAGQPRYADRAAYYAKALGAPKSMVFGHVDTVPHYVAPGAFIEHLAQGGRDVRDLESRRFQIEETARAFAIARAAPATTEAA